jgi:O-antigen/teichoic acid export membrane protein
MFMENLRQQTVSGLGWSAATQILGQALQFAATVVLARLLSPADFGLIGMILVFIGFASSIADMGLGASIIQKQAVTDRHLDSVFWMNVAVGGALTIVFSTGAPLIAEFYDKPQLRLLTIVVALNFLIGSLNVVQNALLQRSLDFRTLFWIESVAISISGITALVLALAGAGVWSLVGQSVSLTAIRTAVMWHLSSWRPGRSFDPAAVKEMLRFGRHVIGSNIIIYWGQNFDKLVIGRQFGSSALGIYNIADRLMRLPLTNVTAVTGAVMFPALSTLQDEVDSVKKVYLRANRLIALLTFPMMLGLVVVAEPAILVFYGEKWRNAVSILQLLSLAGMAQSIYNTAGWIFLSRGRPDILFRLGVLSMLVRVAGVLIGMHWGLVGIAWAYVLGGFACLLYPTWSAAGRLIDLRFVDLLRNAAGPFYCAACMAAAIWLFDQWLLVEQAYLLRLVIDVLTGIVVYGFLIRRFQLESWDEIRKLLLEMGGRRSRSIRWLLGSSGRSG